MKKILTLGALVSLFAAGYATRALLPAEQQPSPPTRPTPQPSATSDAADPTDLLVALGYTEGTIDADASKSGVVLHEPSSSPGVNFYTSRKVHAAHLIDAEGNELHTWSHSWGPWQHAHLYADGDVLVVVQDERLFRLDVNSEVRWSSRKRFHHDVSVDGSGQIYALRHKSEVVPRVHRTAKTLVDYLSILSPEGQELEAHSLVDVLLASPYAYLLPSVSHRSAAGDGGELDLLHANHVEVFDGALAETNPLLAEGNLLISMRNINAIAILGASSNARAGFEVLWLWGPSNVQLQHHPTLLANGNILLFNNGLRRSSVLELDPTSRAIVWEYRHEDFFSATRGSVQRLPNGNTLITESDSGYVFEVTPDQRVVWEFANPDVAPNGLRSSIWRMTRFARTDLGF